MQSVFDSSFLHHFDEVSTPAHGLPSAAYTSADFFRLEQERLFSDGWVFAGFAHQLARRGDVSPVQVVFLYPLSRKFINANIAAM